MYSLKNNKDASLPGILSGEAKGVMPIGKSRRDLRHEGVYSFMLRERTPSTLKKRLALSEAKEVSQVILEGKERSPCPGARGDCQWNCFSLSLRGVGATWQSQKTRRS